MFVNFDLGSVEFGDVGSVCRRLQKNSYLGRSRIIVKCRSFRVLTKALYYVQQGYIVINNNNNALSNELRKKERENTNEFKGHCLTLLQCTACTATLGPI